MSASMPLNSESRLRMPSVYAPSAEIEHPGSRLQYIDNLRWTIILLVISMHAADTYSPLGHWYFVERLPLSTAALLTLAAWQMYLQCFFMGLLFFIAGFFVPASFDRKGCQRFLRDRAFRLGLPTLLYMFCIGPLTEYYLAHSWTSTRATSFAKEWIKHICNGQFLQENGPLWFCLALLIFSTAYALLRAWPARGGETNNNESAPGTGKLIPFALVMASFTFLVRICRPSPFLNMQFGDFPQYILLFSAGIMAARRNWLSKWSFKTGIKWMILALSAGLAYWLLLLLWGGALQGRVADYSGGWHWQSALFCLWESFTCVALCLGFLVLFRNKFKFQGSAAQFLSENAFSVYVFHPPILIAAARFLSGSFWPPLLKFAALTVLTLVTAFGLSAVLFRRIPLLRRIL